MPDNNFNVTGLTEVQVFSSREKFSKNILTYKKENRLIDAIKSLAKEPMILLLLSASIIYFISGDSGDGAFLASANHFC